jgi:hypothetical protein
VDQNQITDLEEFNRKMESYKPGDTILFLVKRPNATIYLTVNVPK